MANICLYILDLDNCFMGPAFQQDPSLDIIRANKLKLDEFIAESAHFDETIVASGSNRINIYMDYINSLHEGRAGIIGSGFPRLKKMSDHMGAEFDPFTITDLFTTDEKGQPVAEGHTYQLAEAYYNIDGVTYDESKLRPVLYKLPSMLEDKYKATLILANIQRIVKRFPNDTITVRFFDDMPEIRTALHNFFSQNDDHLVPEKLTLIIEPYSGTSEPEKEKALKPIVGRGKPVTKLKALIEYMYNLAIASVDLVDNEHGRRIRNFADAQYVNFHLNNHVFCDQTYVKKSNFDEAFVQKGLLETLRQTWGSVGQLFFTPAESSPRRSKSVVGQGTPKMASSTSSLSAPSASNLMFVPKPPEPSPAWIIASPNKVV